MKMIFLTYKNAAVLLLGMLLTQCRQPTLEKAELLLHNGTVHLLDSNMNTVTALAVKAGRIAGVGTQEELKKRFQFDTLIDMQGHHLYPGLIDAHTHFWAYAEGLQRVDLRGSSSPQEVLRRLQDFDEQHHPAILVGRGWDQSLWPGQAFPHRSLLDSLFAERPVILRRIDGHATWANSAALQEAGIDENTEVKGGLIAQENGRLTGILIDNAADLLKVPALSLAQMRPLLLRAQDSLFAQGITAVMEAGLQKEQVLYLQKLQQEGALKLRIDALLSDNAENRTHFLAKGPIREDRLHVQGFKFYLDGALGSRGALLLDGYADDAGNYGLQLNDYEHFLKYGQELYTKGWQMAIHAIGDSANALATRLYSRLLKPDNNRRWRIEHAQVVRKRTAQIMREYAIIPSVQPTHATSDMEWAGLRLGSAEKYAYPYQSLLHTTGHLPLGTDFPVEEINPLKTFRAAVFRQKANGQPAGGYRPEEALSHTEALRGMTIDAAYASFWEKEIGSLKVGKWADMVLLNKDLTKVPFDELPNCRVLLTYTAGERVFVSP